MLQPILCSLSTDHVLRWWAGAYIIASMKPQQLATLLNVTPTTIRRWARDEYTEFLSPTAQGGERLHRSFDSQDARVLAWIAALRAQNKPPADILMTLRSAQADGWRTLPPLPG